MPTGNCFTVFSWNKRSNKIYFKKYFDENNTKYLYVDV